MARITTSSIIEGLTFDDVLLRPGRLRGDADRGRCRAPG